MGKLISSIVDRHDKIGFANARRMVRDRWQLTGNITWIYAT
jgi:hypothetical protein